MGKSTSGALFIVSAKEPSLKFNHYSAAASKSIIRSQSHISSGHKTLKTSFRCCFAMKLQLRLPTGARRIIMARMRQCCFISCTWCTAIWHAALRLTDVPTNKNVHLFFIAQSRDINNNFMSATAAIFTRKIRRRRLRLAFFARETQIDTNAVVNYRV